MYSVRLSSIRHARALEMFYNAFEPAMVLLAPLLRRVGYARLEKPVAAFERTVKGLLFDCQMCGQCALSSTGMSCPMNCPKSLRNGPCGGVRANGNCEVKPDMPCVWVKAWEGSRADAGRRRHPQGPEAGRPVAEGSSSWLEWCATRPSRPKRRARPLQARACQAEGRRQGADMTPQPSSTGMPMPLSRATSRRGRLERVLRAASSPSPPS